MVGIYISGGISGAHLNPAISIMLSILRGFPWRMCFIYILAQFAGAVLASLIIAGVYYQAIINAFDTLDPAAAGSALYTQPQLFVNAATAFFYEVIASAILGSSVLALGHNTNAFPWGMHAFILGLFIAMLGMSFVYNASGCLSGGGYLNPVRDFETRLLVAIVGYGRAPFMDNNYYWTWGAICGPVVGMLLGGVIYDVMIFVWGESPVNHPPRRRRRSWLKSCWDGRGDWGWGIGG